MFMNQFDSVIPFSAHFSHRFVCALRMATRNLASTVVNILATSYSVILPTLTYVALDMEKPVVAATCIFMN